jgi:hypothetical protein
MLIIRTVEGNPGSIRVTAKADDLKEGKTDIHSGDNLPQTIGAK